MTHEVLYLLRFKNLSPDFGEKRMRRYVIERDLAGVGSFSAEQMRDAAQTSVSAVSAIGSGIQWVHTYVTADRLYCVYLAENEHVVRDHAKRAGLPATQVTEVKRIIDPITAVSHQD